MDPPGTADTKENTEGGILIVMPPGFGPLKKPGDEESALSARGLITSRTVDRGPAVSALLEWLDKGGFPVREAKRAFSVFVWPSVSLKDRHGPRQIPVLTAHAEELFSELEKRRPRILIFLSCYLFDAFSGETLEKRLFKIIGRPLAKPRRIAETRLRTEVRRYERALVLAFPIPGRNTTPRFVNSLAGGLAGIFEEIGLAYKDEPGSKRQ